ncbi:MAG: NAD-dependent epimerase/dehydratase family protein [Candidatus Binatia bacterium]
MKILVTGGAGFIGSHIAQACVEAGHEVLVVDDLSSGHLTNVPEEASFEELDIRSEEVANLIVSEKPDFISHHAAQINVRVSVEQPIFDASVNVLGLVNVVEAARRAGTRRVIFASSGGTVYGDPEVLPCDEGQPLHPVCPYGVSKLSGEHYLHYYALCRGVAYTALRYANVYGPRQDPHGEAGVIAIFCEKLLRDEDVMIFGDGEQTRDYVFVGDVVRANMACLEAGYDGGVNIGTGKETNVLELSELLRGLIGGKGVAVHGEARDGEVRRSVLDASLAAKVLNWEPRTSLTVGLAETVDFFRSRI